jgi:hypothetical protein
MPRVRSTGHVIGSRGADVLRVCSGGPARGHAGCARLAAGEARRRRWPVTFPGFDTPGYGDDWHIDGGWFCHHVWSPEQALLNLFCFSSVEAGGAAPCWSSAPTIWPPVCRGRPNLAG